MFWLTLIYFYNTWQGSSAAERRAGVLQEQFPAPPAPTPSWAPTPKSVWAHKVPVSPASCQRSLSPAGIWQQMWPLGTQFSWRTVGLSDLFQPKFHDFQHQNPVWSRDVPAVGSERGGHTWMHPGHLLLLFSSCIG